jgi:2-polyprenyl-3-methyl-5-hydroxy-6-metoxy-1,4-benzoquinol methylase
LLRTWLVADEETLRRRVDELARMASAPGEPPLSIRLDVPELDVAVGYARWATSYDEAANPLIRVEEPVVRALIDRVPAGRALDAACGTGRHTAYLASRGHRVAGVDATAERLLVRDEPRPQQRESFRSEHVMSRETAHPFLLHALRGGLRVMQSTRPSQGRSYRPYSSWRRHHSYGFVCG